MARRRKRLREADRPGGRSGKRAEGRSSRVETDRPPRNVPAPAKPENFALTSAERECFKRQSDLARLLPHLEKAQDHPQSVAELCNHAIATPGVLRRLIWNAMKLRPHDLAMRCAIRDVARAVLASEEPIDDIRVRFGFRSAEALCRAFTRITGCCPREYRRRHLAADDLRTTG